jgi:hypothetical protein
MKFRVADKLAEHSSAMFCCLRPFLSSENLRNRSFMKRIVAAVVAGNENVSIPQTPTV